MSEEAREYFEDEGYFSETLEGSVAVRENTEEDAEAQKVATARNERIRRWLSDIRVEEESEREASSGGDDDGQEDEEKDNSGENSFTDEELAFWTANIQAREVAAIGF